MPFFTIIPSHLTITTLGTITERSVICWFNGQVSIPQNWLDDSFTVNLPEAQIPDFSSLFEIPVTRLPKMKVPSIDPKIDLDLEVNLDKLMVPSTELPEFCADIDLSKEMPDFRMPGGIPDIDVPIGVPDVDVENLDVPNPGIWRGLKALAGNFGELMDMSGKWWDVNPEIANIAVPLKKSHFEINEDEEQEDEADLSSFFLHASNKPTFRLANGSDDDDASKRQQKMIIEGPDSDCTKIKLVPGLSGTPGTVSFENAKRPGFYYRHQSYWLCEHNYAEDPEPEVMAPDASWYVRRALKVPKGGKAEDYISFESENFPGFFLRHKDHRLRIDDITDADKPSLFKKDATWQKSKVEFPPEDGETFHCCPSNAPACRFVNGNDEDPLTVKVEEKGADDDAVTKIKIKTPGLSGTVGTVSLENSRRPGYFYRYKVIEDERGEEHRWLCEMDFENADGVDREAFMQEGSFWPRAPLTDHTNKSYVSFESEKEEGWFIRNQGGRLMVNELEADDEIFKLDATWIKSGVEGEWTPYVENRNQVLAAAEGVDFCGGDGRIQQDVKTYADALALVKAWRQEEIKEKKEYPSAYFWHEHSYRLIEKPVDNGCKFTKGDGILFFYANCALADWKPEV